MQSCPENNGCFYQSPSRCVLYDGPFLTNLSILPGQNLTDILRKIDILISGGGGSGLQKVEHNDTSTASINGDGTVSSPLTVTFLGTSTQLNADWNSISGVTQILNKPNLATVAITGSYDDLTNKPSIPSSPVNADWNSISGLSQILNKPVLATVATTGNYNDLSNKPNLSLYYLASNPSGYITSASLTWNNVTGKPTFSTVAITGNYNDLTNKPVITAPVNANWNATSGLAQILNKPIIPAAQVNSDWASNTGLSRILNKPTTVAGYGITDVYTKTQTDGLYIPLSQRGVANGVSTLDSGGHIPLSQINITTSNIAEGTNLYYTNTRVQTFSDDRYVPLTRILNVGVGLTGGGDLSVDRTIGLDLSYLDDRYSSGYKQKESVKVASSSNITLSGLQAVDGVALLAGDRILVKGQTDGSENGIYIVSTGAWTRSTDFDSVGPGGVEQGAAIFIEDGTTLGKTGWSLSTGGTIVLDTTPLSFIQYSGSINYSAGTGLSLVGNGFFAQTTLALWNAATIRGIPVSTTAPTTNQILRYNGSSWTPFTPNYLTSETDPVAIAKTITITGASPITVTGAAQTIGSNPSFSLSHAVSGVTAGTYAKVSVNATGHVTGASVLVAGDIPNLDSSKITTGVFSTVRLGTGTASSSTYLRGDGVWNTFPSIPQGTLTSVALTSADITVTGSPITSSGTFTLTLPNKLTAGTYKSVTVNAKGIVTAGANPTTLAGFGITDAAPISGSGNYIWNQAGSQQTGTNFWISGTGISGNFNSTATTGSSDIQLHNGSYGNGTQNRRWSIFKQTSEASGNVGNDLNIGRYDNSGVYLSSPFVINRSTGIITMNGGFRGKDGSGITGTGTTNNVARLLFYQSDNTTQDGYVGLGSTATKDVYLVSNNGNINLRPGANNQVFQLTPTALNLTGALTVGNIANETTDVDKILVSNGGLIKYRTGAQILSDIGAATSSHTHTLTLTGAVTGTGTITGSIATTLANLDGSKITTGTVGGARLGSGSTNYIQNGTSLQASSNFNISGLAKSASLTVTGISTFGATGTTIGSFGEIHGKSTLTSDGTIYPIAGIFMDTGSTFTYTPGAAEGRILTSDASGEASWRAPSGGYTSSVIGDGTYVLSTSINYYIIKATANNSIHLTIPSGGASANTGKIISVLNPTAFSYVLDGTVMAVPSLLVVLVSDGTNWTVLHI